MASSAIQPSYQWHQAKSLMSASDPFQTGLQGALVPDSQHEYDHIAVVYNRGDTPPEITIKQISGGVHQVLANGIAVAIVAKTEGRAPTPDDVLLVERYV